MSSNSNPGDDRSGLLVIAHGSRDAAAVAEFGQQVARLHAALADVSVGAAVLEFPGQSMPSIQDGYDALAATGVRHILVLPLFLFDAGHVRFDIPNEIGLASVRHPGTRPTILRALRVEDGLLEVLSERAADAGVGQAPGGASAILLVGAGTSSPTANAELYRVSRLLWERGAADLVEVAFVSLTRPSVAQGLDRCLALGAKRITVLPYFLNTGVLARRIHDAVLAHPQADRATVGVHIGAHPRMIEALAQRVRRELA